jgi:predicted DCC family thiol-disulfide oxidoreductase YuxK
MNRPNEIPDADCGTLFYDGACPLCNAEVRRLRELADDRLRLVDVHEVAPEQPAGAAGPECAVSPEGAGALPGRVALLRNLHYRRSDGTVLSGLDANVAAWQHTRLGPLWRWLRWPVIRPIADRCYAFWARKRYRGLYDEGGRRLGA